MRTTLLVILIVILVSTLGIDEAFSQRRTPPAKPVPPKHSETSTDQASDVTTTISPTPDVYLQHPFNLEAEILPPNFQGHNLRAIFEELNKRAGEKRGEFESSVEFQQRIKELNEKPLYGEIHITSLVAFVLSSESLSRNSSYDADSLAMKVVQPVDILRGASLEENHPPLRTLPWNQSVVDGGSYTATNAFGAERVVTKTNSVAFDLAFSIFNWTWQSSVKIDKPGPPLFEDYSFQFRFPVNLSIAKETKENLGFLVIGRPTTPYTLSRLNAVKATFAKPTDMLQLYFYLNVDVLELWVFDRKTGKVHYKYRSNS